MSSIPGPNGAIPYERDAWGYPTVAARDIAEGNFALGYMHALDRLVQVRINSMLAQGRCLEILGEGTLARTVDRAARLFDFAGDAEEQVARMQPATRTLLKAYCDGFEAGTRQRGWPVILRLLRIPRTPFTPAHVVSLYRLLAFFGLTSIQQIALSVIGELAAVGAPKRTFDLLLGERAGDVERAELPRMEWPAQLRFLVDGPRGSNAFAISQKRSATGGALLMTEPHMDVAVLPPLLYASHLEQGDGDFRQGLSAPGNPFILFGRTRHVAWGYTYGHGDSISVLVERCRNGTYEDKGKWHPFRRRVEQVRVRGKRQPEEWIYSHNDFGTVLGDASGEAHRPAMRWSGLQEIWQDFDAGPKVLAARTVRDLQDANRGLKILSLHGVLADSSGDVGYVQTGQVDERPAGWSGAIPFPAAKLDERRFVPMAEARRPCITAPAEGFIASANEARKGPDGSVWDSFPEPPYRFQRLTQLLAARERFSLSDFARISYDLVDGCAERLLAAWATLLPADAKPLVEWAAHQPAAGEAHWTQMALFHRLHREVLGELLGRLIGVERGRRLFAEMIGDVCFQFEIDNALARERPDVLGDDELRPILALAWSRVRGEPADAEGPVPLRVKFKNLITQGKVPFPGLDSPPLLIPGGPTSMFQSRRVRVQALELTIAPACHFVTDLHEPGGWYNIAGGASERRFGPGYGKALEAWRTGHFLPLGTPAGPAPQVGLTLPRENAFSRGRALLRRLRRAESAPPNSKQSPQPS